MIKSMVFLDRKEGGSEPISQLAVFGVLDNPRHTTETFIPRTVGAGWRLCLGGACESVVVGFGLKYSRLPAPLN